MSRPCYALRLLVLSALSCGCQPAGRSDEPQPRPVTVLRIQSRRPEQLARYTGTVSSWKTEDLAFQVGGRLKMILEPGKDIEGETFDENGEPISTGAVIARLETERYTYRLDTARARKRTAEAQLSAATSEVNNVLPRRTAAAQANFDFAKEDFARVERLYKQNAESKARRDQAEAGMKTAEAELQQLQETVAVKDAERASYAAQVAEAEELVRSAQKDLDDTVLRSPFHGQIAEVYQILGGVAQSGQPVCRVQMMDPIQIEVQVSAETDTTLNFNEFISVYTPGDDTPQPALVYEKAALADPSTRTFQVTLLMRNPRLQLGMPREFDPQQDIRVRELRGFMTAVPDGQPPYYIGTEALHQDQDGQYYVWKVDREGFDREQIGKNSDSKLPVKAVRVTPGERRMPFANVAVLRELSEFDSTQLDPQTDLAVGRFRDMTGAELEDAEAVPRVRDRGYVYFVQERWKLRPGEVVRADVSGQAPQSGFYVPINAVARVGDQSFVFVVQTEDEQDVAQRVAVEAEAVEDNPTLRLIRPVGDNAALAEGTAVVVEGVHFLADGEAVRVTGSREQP